VPQSVPWLRLKPCYDHERGYSSKLLSSRAGSQWLSWPAAMHTLKNTQIMDLAPLPLIHITTTGNQHLSKFEYIIKMFYNEQSCHEKMGLTL
jgi:hypothetical protein